MRNKSNYAVNVWNVHVLTIWDVITQIIIKITNAPLIEIDLFKIFSPSISSLTETKKVTNEIKSWKLINHPIPILSSSSSHH